ncbi:MAG: VOC family protein [Rhodobiaceae bacterium]|nr:VOC family protein [Rhodobiaceae bacterium]MCC0057105.1 VOC family protein [Rhodobiaceae bacterium]
MHILSIDHIVITAADEAASVAFYEKVLGMEVRRQPGRPVALHFGDQKMHIHQAGREFRPNARAAAPGTADLCFLTDLPLSKVKAQLAEYGVTVEVDTVIREGARGPMASIYFRDPDGNLVEVSNYAEATAG